MPKRCSTCCKVAEISARAMMDGTYDSCMREIAGLVSHQNQPKAKPKPREEKKFSADVERLYALFIEEQGVEPHGIKQLRLWKDAVRLMIDRDKITPGQIEKIIRWVAQDVCEGRGDRNSWIGWKYQIRSLPKMRDKCNTIMDRMRMTVIEDVKDSKDEELGF